MGRCGRFYPLDAIYLTPQSWAAKRRHPPYPPPDGRRCGVGVDGGRGGWRVHIAGIKGGVHDEEAIRD